MTAPRPADARGNGGKPTPGPWRVEGRFIRALKVKVVAEVPMGGIFHGKVDQANARLIAAAPLLFDALTALVEARRHADECGCDDDCDVALDLWRTVDRLSVAALAAASPAPDADAGEGAP